MTKKEKSYSENLGKGIDFPWNFNVNQLPVY